MTNKKWLYAAIIVFALVLIAGLIFLLWPSGEQARDPEQTTGGTTDGTAESTSQPSGVEDSVFDQPELGDKKPVADQNETTIPQESTAGTDGDTTGSTVTGATSGGQTSGDQTSGGELPAPGEMTYEEFIALSPADQRKYQESFGTDDAGLDAFFAWYNAAKTKYEQENPPIDIGDGVIDLGKLPT